VSARRYIVGPANDLLARRDTRGIHESSADALKIMQVTTAMVVVLIIWCTLTLVKNGATMPPLPAADTIRFSHEAAPVGFRRRRGRPSRPSPS
jgi:hypothetical protein